VSTGLNSALSAGAHWCLGFIERRCRSCISAALVDEAKPDEAQEVAGASVLSVGTINLGEAAEDTTPYEHLAVFALGILRPSSAPSQHVVLRFVTSRTMRSAGRGYGGRWLINEIAIPTPEGFDELSFLVYRVRRSPRVERLLTFLDKAVEIAESAGDSENLVLGRATLEQLEVLEDGANAEVILSGFRLRFADSSPGRDERHLAVLAAGTHDAVGASLWLSDRKLYEGPARAVALPVEVKPYALFRLGPPSTHQSVREFIAEIRRRHQRLPSEGESFANLLERHVDSQKSAKLQSLSARFGRVSKDQPLVVRPVRVEVGSGIVPLVSDGPNKLNDHVRSLIETIRDKSMDTVGFKSPPVFFEGSLNLSASDYQISIKGAPVSRGTVHPDKRWCRQPTAVAGAQGLKPVGGLDPETGVEISWLDMNDFEKAQAAGYRCDNAIAYIIEHLAVMFRKYAHELITIDDIVALLKPAPTLLLAVRSAPGGLPQLLAVISILLRESVPVRDWQTLANRYLELADSKSTLRQIVEELRMVPPLRSALPGNASGTRLILIRGPFTDALRTGVEDWGIVRGLSLEPDVAALALSELRRHLSTRNAPKSPILVVEDPDLRPHVFNFLEHEIPGVQVLSLREVLHTECIEDWTDSST
jgi:hypothetical protein